MSTAPNFIWYELMTPDCEAAAAFYGAVIGWTIPPQAAAVPGLQEYRMIVRADGGQTGAAMAITAEMAARGARPCWVGYLPVPDVDEAVAATQAAGGRLTLPPMDLPVGRIAMVEDPQGAPHYVMTPVPPPGQPDAVSTVFSVDQAQHGRWNELHSTDPDGSVAWYAARFGWTQQGEMPMGPAGAYRFIQSGGVGIGAILPVMDGSAQSRWLFYFGVTDIDRAVAAVTAHGGSVAGAPTPIPGGEFSVVAHDPHGAQFGMVGPRS